MFDLLDVQGTLKSLLHLLHNSKASVLWHSPFFMVQLSHLYMATGKTIALTIWTFVSKVMSLFFNVLSWFVIAFLPRSKHLLISWLQSQSEGFRVAQMVKRLPAMWETWVRSLGREDPLEKEMASHSSTLAWKIPWMEESGGLQSMVSQRVRHD